jgi:hypothetical protein
MISHAGTASLLTTMKNKEHFELRRQFDDIVYGFYRMLLDDGCFGYNRRDSELWILKKPNYGWVAINPSTGDIAGRSWITLPDDQSDFPPEGDWVSKKDTKSYVYTLLYVSD